MRPKRKDSLLSTWDTKVEADKELHQQAQNLRRLDLTKTWGVYVATTHRGTWGVWLRDRRK